MASATFRSISRRRADTERVAGEVPEMLGILTEMNEKLSIVTQHISRMRKRITDTSTFSTEKGIGLLEVKHHLLLSYLINLVQLMLRKSGGESISGCPSVERIVEIRTVLERIRPLDQKLRYQVDKLIKMASTGLTAASDNPLRFKPNIDNLVSKLDDGSEESGEEEEEEEEEEGEERKVHKAKLYVPPRIRAMPFDEDGVEDRQQRRAERLRKKAVHSSLVQELREELWEMPEEIKVSASAGMRRRREVEEESERERFEEEHFVRLQNKRKKEAGHGVRDTMKELTDFGDLQALTEDDGSFRDKAKSSRKKRKLSKVARRFKRGKKGHKGRH